MELKSFEDMTGVKQPPFVDFVYEINTFTNILPKASKKPVDFDYVMPLGRTNHLVTFLAWNHQDNLQSRKVFLGTMQ